MTETRTSDALIAEAIALDSGVVLAVAQYYREAGQRRIVAHAAMQLVWAEWLEHRVAQEQFGAGLHYDDGPRARLMAVLGGFLPETVLNARDIFCSAEGDHAQAVMLRALGHLVGECWDAYLDACAPTA